MDTYAQSFVQYRATSFPCYHTWFVSVACYYTLIAALLYDSSIYSVLCRLQYTIFQGESSLHILPHYLKFIIYSIIRPDMVIVAVVSMTHINHIVHIC